MFKRALLFIVVCTCAFNNCNSQSLDNLKAINKVWDKFYLAFEDLNYIHMADIHSKDLVRISGGKYIIDYNTYISNYKFNFQRDKQTHQSNSISLRFFERINNDSTASERGIYKLVKNKGSENEQSYYGKFHVLFKKNNGVWKITMDYDSTESGTIGESDYLKAHAINDYEKFTNPKTID